MADTWQAVLVELGDPEPPLDLRIKLVEIGERIGLTWLGDDAVAIYYEAPPWVNWERIITAISAGADMLGIGINAIELHQYADRAADEHVVRRWERSPR
jgi:hypothetical protein